MKKRERTTSRKTERGVKKHNDVIPLQQLAWLLRGNVPPSWNRILTAATGKNENHDDDDDNDDDVIHPASKGATTVGAWVRRLHEITEELSSHAKRTAHQRNRFRPAAWRHLTVSQIIKE